MHIAGTWVRTADTDGCMVEVLVRDSTVMQCKVPGVDCILRSTMPTTSQDFDPQRLNLTANVTLCGVYLEPMSAPQSLC